MRSFRFRAVATAIAAATALGLGSPWLVSAQPAAVTPSVAAPPATSAPPIVAAAKKIPDPKQYFGFTIGDEGKLAGHDKMMRYLKLNADLSDRVDYHVAGKTTMGNDYVYLTISSPKNLANLDKYVAINQRLADPTGLTDARAHQLAKQGIPILLLQAGIHSTEVGNVQAMMDMVHRLATENSDFTKQVLNNSIIVVVPSQNPDGDKLVTDYFNKTAGTDFARVYPDLYHKYTGHDDNRDWFTFTQVEPRYYVQLMSKFRPASVHIMHQMGATGDRIFTPPYKDPFDPSIDPKVVQQTSALGMEMANALTASGKKGVSWNSTYDWWIPSVWYEPYHGVPNVLTEIAAAKDLAYTYTSADGKPLGSQQQLTRFVEPYDKATWSLRQIVDYAETAAYANMENVSLRGEQLMYGQYQAARDTVQRTDGPFAYVIPAGQRDPYATYDLLKIMQTGEVQIDRAEKAFTAGGKEYAAGSYVIRMNQRFGRWADMLLKVWDYPEIRACDTCPIIKPYDVAGQTLWMLFGVTVDTVDQPFRAALSQVKKVAPDPVQVPAIPKGAYLVPATSYGVGHFLGSLQQAGVPTYRASESFTAAGTTFAPGTLVIPPTRVARTALAKAATATGIPVYAAAKAPKVAGFELKAGTRIGMVRGINNMPGGWLWWLFDQYGVTFTQISADDFKGDLTDKFDTILLPSGITKSKLVNGIDTTKYPAEFGWAAGIGEAGWNRLRNFVQDGGNLVALGSASETARDLLDLPIKNVVPKDEDAFFVPGSLMDATFDTTDPVAWGMPDEWPVWFDQDAAFQVTDDSKAHIASGYPKGKPLLRSGYASGDEVLQGTSDVVTFDIGAGHVVVAGSQLTFRTWSRATITMVFNALYQGPSKEVDTVLPGS